ncbi:MAG TPA: hypothetical protein VGZ26_01055 [Pirellulales bacterium]|nr:hypothetical protein [Pirellulales bacterium]
MPYESAAISPLDLYSNVQVANVANVAILGHFSPRLSPLGTSGFGGTVGEPASFGGGSGDVLQPVLTGDSIRNERQISIAPSPAMDETMEQLGVMVGEIARSFQAPEIYVAVAIHTEVIPPASVTPYTIAERADVIPPPSVGPYVDFRMTHEPARAGNAEGDQHVNQSAPVLPVSAESLARASQTTSAVGGENRMPAFVPPALPPQVAMSMTPPGNTIASGTPPGLNLVPQSGLDAIEPPHSRALKSELKLGNLPSGSTLPNGGAEKPGADNTATLSLALGGPIGGEVTDAMSASNRAALLASLPFNMDAVDRALAVMMNEIEGMGGELVTWLDDASVPPWAVAATLAEASGLAAYHFWRTRGRRSAQEESEEESSSWLFTRLQSPAGHL